MKLTLKKTAIAFALATSLVNFSYAKTPEGVNFVTEIEGISEYQLDNGLRVLLFPDQSQKTITVNVTYNVGSKHENYGETGMAHLLEHLDFKGTPKHPNIAKELSDHGAEPNGTTWTDRTNYFETFAATDENLNWALDMEADRMINSFISAEDLESEMTVVRNEFEMGENSPLGVLLKRMMATSFHWHNYGKSTIGARSDIENVPVERLKAFYTKYYQPDNATLIVAGKFDKDKVVKLVDKYFGDIAKPERQLPKIYTQEPVQDGERKVVVRRSGDVQMVSAMYKIPPGSHPDYPAVAVLNQILGDYKTGRLQKDLVQKKLAAKSYGFSFQWAEPGLMIFAAEVAKDKDLGMAEKALLNTLESAAQNKITAKEVDQAKANLLRQLELKFNSSERVALELSEWLGMGDWRLLFLNRDRLEQVTLEQVQQVAETYLVNDNRTLGAFIPESKPQRAELPLVSKEELAAMLDGYKGREMIAQGEDFDPSHDNIDKRTQEASLANGAKVRYVAKKTRGESVVFQIQLDNGNLEALYGKGKVPQLTTSMLMRGTKRLDREALQAEFDKLKASVRVYGGAANTNVRVTTTKENLPQVIKLVEEVLKSPKFDSKELETLVEEQLVQLDQERQQPLPALFRRLNAHLNPYDEGHPSYNMSIDEEIEAIKQIDTKALAKFHKQFFGASEADIAIVGDFDRELTHKLLQQSFGDWNAKVNYQRIASTHHKVDAINESINTPDKAGAGFAAMIPLAMSDNHPDYPALTMANYIFGGGFLSSRLAVRLRQQDGLSYGAGSWFWASAEDEVAGFGAYAICAPENLEKVEVGFKEEFMRVVKEGFSEQELADAKKGFLQNKEIDRAKDSRLVTSLVSQIDLKRNMAWDKDFEQALANLTVEQVNNAFRKHFKLENTSIVKAGDLAKLSQN